MAHEAIIHDFQPYPKAIRWSLQKTYFEERGPEAWRQRDIPFRITSNSLAARQNAALVLEAISAQQKIGSLNEMESIIVTELGCGLGLFAYHFLRQFERLCDEQGRSDFKRLRYLATDYVQSNIISLSQGNHMANYIHSGQLELGQIDGANPLHLKRYCTHSKTFRPSESLPPLSAVITNYMHCCLPGNIIGRKDGVWFEKHIQSVIKLLAEEVENALPVADILNQPNAIDRVQERGQWVPTDINNLCINAFHRMALDDISTDQHNNCFMSSSNSLNNITKLSQYIRPMGVYLIHDKACVNTKAHEFNDIYDHTNHGNSTAYMVNFPLLRAYAKRLGLQTYMTTSASYTVQTLALQKGQCSAFQAAFRLGYEDFNVNQHMAYLYRLAKDCLSVCHFSMAAQLYEKFLYLEVEDPDIFLNLSKALIALGNTQRAQCLITKGRQLDPFHLMNFDHVEGLLAHAQGKKAYAQHCLQRALAAEHNPEIAKDIKTLISVYNMA